MRKFEIIDWLQTEDPSRLQALWDLADSIRQEHVGPAIHLRGLVEFSNRCERHCTYCGIRKSNSRIIRYWMEPEEILSCAQKAVEFGYGTLVLQSGEDYSIPSRWIQDVIHRVKSETPLAITLSVGERSTSELKAWREAGADRYLLRFETSNPKLYQRIHPARSGCVANRIEILEILQDIGYETGSGVMIGIPGQTYEDLANDILLFKQLQLDMIGIGPFIAHPDTPLSKQTDRLDTDTQVPNSEDMTYKALALTRIICPSINLPSTTALASLNQSSGRELGLVRGANIIMPNLTPIKYRRLYEIYPAKACLQESERFFRFELQQKIESIGRIVGAGRGDSPNMDLRHARN